MTKEYEYVGKVMGTEFAIAIVTKPEEEAGIAAGIGTAILHDYERRFSRFLPESELSLLNTTKDMQVSPLFLKILSDSIELARETGGVFNPLLQISRLGYNKDFALIGSGRTDVATGEEEYNIDFTAISINTESSRVILQSGQKLDFGGFLKGKVAETVARTIMDSFSGIRGVVVNLGGDIHTLGTDVDGFPFTFSIFNPITGDEGISVTLQNTGLATSGTYKRHWERGAGQVHHILSKDGVRNPDSDVVSSSVILEDGGRAEAYAKVLLSLGPERAEPFLRAANAKYVAITKDGKSFRKNI